MHCFSYGYCLLIILFLYNGYAQRCDVYTPYTGSINALSANSRSVWAGSDRYLVTRLKEHNLEKMEHFAPDLVGKSSEKMDLVSFITKYSETHLECLVSLIGHDLSGALQLDLAMRSMFIDGVNETKSFSLVMDPPVLVQPDHQIQLGFFHNIDDDNSTTPIIIFTDGNHLYLVRITCFYPPKLDLAQKIEFSDHVKFFKASKFALDQLRGIVYISSLNSRFIKSYSISNGSLLYEHGFDTIPSSDLCFHSGKNILILSYISDINYIKFISMNDSFSSSGIYFLPQNQWIVDMVVDDKQQLLHILTQCSTIHPSIEEYQKNGITLQSQERISNLTQICSCPFSWATLNIEDSSLLRNISTGDILFPRMIVNDGNVYIRGIHKDTLSGTLFAFSYKKDEESQSLTEDQNSKLVKKEL